MAFVASCGEEDGGAVEEGDEPGAGDTDDALVPVVVGEDDCSAVVGGHACGLGEFCRGVGDGAFDRASFVVEGGELVCDGGGAGLVGGGEEFDGFAGVAEASAGVESWSELEADVVGVEAVAGETRGVDE